VAYFGSLYRVLTEAEAEHIIALNKKYRKTKAKETRVVDLIMRLDPFAKGCFSGHIDEWPQLKPLMWDLYRFLIALDMTANKRED